MSNTLTVLCPVIEPASGDAAAASAKEKPGMDAAKSACAPRPATLRGARLALFENGKVNARQILTALGERLKARYGVAEVSFWRKPDPSTSGAAFIAPMLAWRPDLVLTALGD